MKKLLLSLLVLPVLLMGQVNYNLSLLGSYDWPTTEGNDIWGWVDPLDGKEYALVGLNNGFSCVDVTIASNPIEIFHIMDLNSTWRDVKTWGNYAYVTTEAHAGLLIVDLSDMTGNTYWHITTFNHPTAGSSIEFTAAHNLYIDENGICYIFGASSNLGGTPADGAIFLDVAANPTAPHYLGEWNDHYIHDGMVREDTMYAGCIYAGELYVVDVSNKDNPVTIGHHTTPNNFTHNVWVSDDGDFVFTTDETSDAYLAAYDITDINNIQEVDRIQSNPGGLSIPHNAHVDGNFLITSYYRDGTTVHDITNPSNMIQVAFYDSYGGSGDGFDGCWGTYPFLPSGIIISSEINSNSSSNAQLLIYERGFVQACYLEGNVTDFITGSALSGASIEILNTTIPNNTSSNLYGDYVSGTADAATYDIVFSKSGYLSDTIAATLSNGVLTVINAALQPLIPFNASGIVIDNAAVGIANTEVLIYNGIGTYTTVTDANGNFNIANIYEGIYQVVVGKWTYVTSCNNEYISPSSAILTITLEEGYYDDFSFDFSWDVSGNAIAGIWERGEPQGTSYQGADFNPDYDVTTDCTNFAFVTGNDGGGAGDDDVDGGNTILRSPVFDLTNNSLNYLSYYSWFSVGGGSSTSNDSLKISISNGTTNVVIETYSASSSNLGQWNFNSIDIAQYMTPTATMQLVIETADNSSGHLVEAAFDKFQITDTPPLAIVDLSPKKGKLLKIVDVLGRDVDANTNGPVFYIYEGGAVDKKIIIE